jgi:hypothetical protein
MSTAPVHSFAVKRYRRTQILPRTCNVWLYRDRTIRLLRRYLRLAVEAGRLPSLLGRELFGMQVTAYHITTFEDARSLELAVPNIGPSPTFLG